MRVGNETGRPAAGDVVEEQTGQIRRTAEVFTCPFGGEVHLCPVGQLGGNLTVQGIAMEFVRSVLQESLLVKQVTAQNISDFFITAADADVMFLRRHILVIEFIEPVGIGERAAIVPVTVVLRIHRSTIIFRLGWVGEFTVQVFPDV